MKERENRYPVCFGATKDMAPEDKIANGCAECPHQLACFFHATIHSPVTAKPSNPKDACGIKKAPMSTVPANVLAEIGVAMLDGAGKYGRHNYRVIGVRASVYYDAVMRHLFAWWEGEDFDPDSGMLHITKALSSLVVLRDAMHQGKYEDDRPPKSEGFYPGLNERTASLVERDDGLEVKHYTEAGK